VNVGLGAEIDVEWDPDQYDYRPGYFVDEACGVEEVEAYSGSQPGENFLSGELFHAVLPQDY